jgi:hypothetical protein
VDSALASAINYLFLRNTHLRIFDVPRCELGESATWAIYYYSYLFREYYFQQNELIASVGMFIFSPYRKLYTKATLSVEHYRELRCWLSFVCVCYSRP